MYVRRLILHGVKSLWREIPSGGEALPPPTRQRLLLQGGNGSGKTTILEAVALLWQLCGEWMDFGHWLPDRERPKLIDRILPAFLDAELVAVELADFPVEGESLWVGIGALERWSEFKHQHPGAAFAGAGIPRKTGQPRLTVELPNRDWQTFRHRSMVGTEPQPNVVYFPPDNRSVAPAPREGPRLIDTTQLNWLATYDPQLDLESVLLTIQALRPETYAETLRYANLALRHRNKRIVGFGNNGRLQVEGQGERGATYTHPVEALSSGERQLLLLITYTAGFLRRGGIVLIDEPDLHLHIGMVTQLMETLGMVARERGGQLIVASHSERVWDWFSRDSEKIELTPWRGGEAG